MSRFWSQDLPAVVRGMQTVLNASVKLHEAEWRTLWNNSSVKACADVDKLLRNNIKGSSNEKTDVTQNFTEAIERTSMVFEGLRVYTTYVGTKTVIGSGFEQQQIPPIGPDEHEQQTGMVPENHSSNQSSEIQHSQDRPRLEPTVQSHESVSMKEPLVRVEKKEYVSEEPNVILTSRPPPGQEVLEALSVPPLMRRIAQKVPVKKQTLSATAKQRKVPASRIARLVSFGSLAAGLGVGTVAEFTRRTLGLANESQSIGAMLDSPFLSEANTERIVDTLCKVRGAALKIGQILSIQDNTMIGPGLQKAFERVRQSADFMPTWQVEQVLASELGDDWRSKVATFETKPFAAASIGQVHLVTLEDGTEVAMKIQYPGVAKGIKSDIDNLVGIMKVWNIFPEGLFIDNIVEVAKRELAWEVDYLREAECTKKFKQFLEPYPDYYVPNVIDKLSSKQIFSTELVEGIPVDKCAELDVVTREHICRLVMQLCLLELFVFRYMQTDPNWSNFLYNPDTRQLTLLDFGASREYDKKFIDQYLHILRGAADGRKDIVLNKSRDIGFLSGYESKVMEEAHVETVMILGEVFRSKTPFDFGQQGTTRQVQQLVPTMLKHRLCPPPEEIYSLHRKLSGIFLLCAKLNAKLECRSMFEEVYSNYKFG